MLSNDWATVRLQVKIIERGGKWSTKEVDIRHVKLSGNLLLGQSERFSHVRQYRAPGVLQPHGAPQRWVNLPGCEPLKAAHDLSLCLAVGLALRHVGERSLVPAHPVLVMPS